jgi:hypothetical protein
LFDYLTGARNTGLTMNGLAMAINNYQSWYASNPKTPRSLPAHCA